MQSCKEPPALAQMQPVPCVDLVAERNEHDLHRRSCVLAKLIARPWSRSPGHTAHRHIPPLAQAIPTVEATTMR
jgi:hypothetical protein